MNGDDEKRRKKALGEAAVRTAVGVSGLVVPGASAVAAGVGGVLNWVLLGRQRRRDREFLGGVAGTLGRSEEELTAEIESSWEETWVQELLCRGLVDLDQCVDELAKKCLCILVADYWGRSHSPTLLYRRCAAILRDSDAELLARLKLVLSLHAEARENAGAGNRYLILRRKRDGADGARTLVVQAGTIGQPEPRESRAVRVDWNIDQVADMLVTHGFAARFTGMSSSRFAPEGESANPLLKFSSEADDELASLAKYLVPVDFPPI